MKTSNKKNRAERFLIVRAVLILAGAASAVIGVLGWLAGGLTFANGMLAVGAGLSAIVVPTSLELVGRGWSGLLMLAPALVFGAINAGSFHHAVEVLVEAPREAAHKAEFAETVTAYDAARKAVLAHAPLMLTPDMPKGRVEMQQASWDKAHAALIAAEASAKASVETIPAYAPMIDKTALLIVSALLDLSLAIGLAGVSLVRAANERKLKKERDKAKRQAAKAKVARPKARKPADVVSEAEGRTLQAAMFGGPRLVYSAQ